MDIKDYYKIIYVKTLWKKIIILIYLLVYISKPLHIPIY
ncbi:hypothetical protein [Plasmodium yoelii yoelii]|uniref:Uncharacterized protein n=1 Tax=Plasmodium yoelii yoelii TaxID=73239 RepID=Q7RH61_PLAYO|nr:hypothetical protein [Plasmodium yoelii yoelii]